MKRKLKVEGSGNRWWIWQWIFRGQHGVSSWDIVAGPYLTKRRAETVRKDLQSPEKYPRLTATPDV